MVWIVKTEGGDFAGELSGPERKRRVRCILNGRSGDVARVRDDDLILVKSENSSGVRKGEFVEGFDDGDERLREHNHARVIDCAEDFLELRHGGDEEKVRVGEKFLGAFGEKVNTVAGEEERFYCFGVRVF